MTSIKLQLDWKPNAQFAGILLAHYLGWYKQSGIDLVIVPWQSHTNPVAALEAPENVIASTEDNLLIRARAAGQPVKAIGVMMQFSPIGWMTLKKSGIRQIIDLWGKRLGIHGDGETVVDIVLARFGMARNELEVVEVGYDYADLLKSGAYDALQCLVMVEPLELEQLGFDLHVLPAYEWGYQVYSQVLATTERLLATESEVLARFLRVTFDGWRQAFQEPEEAGRIIAADYLPETKADLETRMLRAMQPFFEGQVGLAKLGWMEKERWEQSIGYLKQHRLIERPVSAEDVMTNSLMEVVYGA
ncbi:MAG: exported protein [Chloroflexota bacterium]|nr:MAG: exported protein [Chloroflexota bacterium]